MSTMFNPHEGLIIVQARLWGPTGDTQARLALDTGATRTIVNSINLRATTEIKPM